MEPTLPLHLKNAFGADETTAGLMFCAIVIPNAFVSVLIGHLSDRYGRKIVTLVGSLLMVIATPFIAVPKTLPLLTLMLMTHGMFSAIAMTPLMPDLADFVTKRGGGAYGKIYALFNAAYSLGMLAGPMLAGWLYELMGFQWEMVVFAGMLILVLPLMGLAWLSERKERAIVVDESVLVQET